MRNVPAGSFFPVLDSLFWLWTSTEDLSMLWQGPNSFLLDFVLGSMAVAFNRQGVEGKHSSYISSSTRDTSVQGSVLGQNWVYWCDCRRSADCRVFDRFSCVIQLDDQLIYIYVLEMFCLPTFICKWMFHMQCFICKNFYCLCFNIMGVLASTCFRIDVWFGIASVCRLVCQLLR